MDESGLLDWIRRYEEAWRAPGTDALAGLFTDDVVYRNSPYAEPIEGLDAVSDAWEAGRDGPDEVFRMASEVVAVDGDTGVARVVVQYGDPVEQEYTDLWVVRVDGERATEFEEWPFWPGHPWSARGHTD